MILGDRIRQRREELLLTQDDLAGFIGVRVETFDNWERGFSNPKKVNLHALTRALQTTTDYLEGHTDIPVDYSRDDNACIICGKSLPFGMAKCPECRWGKWSANLLNSKDLAKRRKRSHSVNLLTLDREKATATFISTTSYGENMYTTALDMCTCPDFENTHAPCKHIFRLAEELGLFQCEDFDPHEDDYTKRAELFSAEHDDSVPEEACEVSAASYASGVFWKILKIALCCVFGAGALLLILGALTQGKEWVCFPAGFAVAGMLTAWGAVRNGLEGSALKWGMYGALVPFVSWIDVAVKTSRDRVSGLLKGLAYGLVWVVIFLGVFMYFLPRAESQELTAQEIASVYLGENRVLIDPNDDGEDEQVKPKPESSNSAVYVVITPKGKKYHYASCRTVKSKYTKLTIAQARKRGYKPCKVCDPPTR